MHKDQLIGIGLILISVAVIILYGYLMFGPVPQIWSALALRITMFLIIAVLFGILGWVGYTLATTPPPKPIEEIEKEIEEELKKLEAELKKSETKSETK